MTDKKLLRLHECGEYVEFGLTKGHIALVDTEDADRVSQMSWCAQTSRRTQITYAMCKKAENGRKHSWLMHRYILDIKDPSIIIDHANGNGLDNRRVNLRVCTQQKNCFNATKRIGTFHSKFKGVCRQSDMDRWRANITRNSKSVHLGLFTSEIEAAAAYNYAAEKLFGEFAKLNAVPKLPVNLATEVYRRITAKFEGIKNEQ